MEALAFGALYVVAVVGGFALRALLIWARLRWLFGGRRCPRG